MRLEHESRFRATYFVAAVIATITPTLIIAQSTASAHRSTCTEGLRTYSKLADVPVPHDTLRPSLSAVGSQVHGMTPIDSHEQLIERIRVAGARVGATGILVESGGGEDNGLVRLGRTLPVFVPSDTARIYRECPKP